LWSNEGMSEHDLVQATYQKLSSLLDERSLRLWAAATAQALGRGGITLVARSTRMTRARIGDGLAELRQPAEALPRKRRGDRIRRRGGGRKPIDERFPGVLEALEALVEPLSRGDPMSALRWTCKSLRHLAVEMTRQGYPMSQTTVAKLLGKLGYSLQANRKSEEGDSHPDRDAQFEHINACCEQFVDRGQPVISVDTKKKELVGSYKNAGREWERKGCPEEVRVHDFPDEELGKAIPYGVLDLARNEGWVSVGTDHDTSEFAVQTILNWWRQMGRTAYPEATELLVTADGGGSNGTRVRLWKVALQRLSDETGLSISVCHFPPGTSKWNKIEHRMFSHITQNWRGRPLVSHEVIVNLIGNTRTAKGLSIQAELDTNAYPTGIKVSATDFAAVNLDRDDFHGDWNYTIRPGPRPIDRFVS